MGNKNKPGTLKENFGFRILKISVDSPASKANSIFRDVYDTKFFLYLFSGVIIFKIIY
jgi:hypothetical protein